MLATDRRINLFSLNILAALLLASATTCSAAAEREKSPEAGAGAIEYADIGSVHKDGELVTEPRHASQVVRRIWMNIRTSEDRQSFKESIARMQNRKPVYLSYTVTADQSDIEDNILAYLNTLSKIRRRGFVFHKKEIEKKVAEAMAVFGYYNPEIKRFINQDILYGDATNSQSLNRYAYVQGNPINYNDPFGLSPMKVLQAAFTPIHDILNIAGIVPGPIGTFADLGNAFLYSLEGNSSMASKYVVQAFVTSIAMPLGGTVIGTLCGSNKAVKIMVGLGIMGAGAYSILTSGQGLIENFKELKNEFSKEDRDYLKILHYGSGVISNTAGVVYGINSMYGGFTAMFGKCFVAGTKIKTEDGDKNIEDIEVGDRVYSYNPETGEEGYKTVKRTFIKESDEIVHVTITNADKSESVTIDATPGHPFYVVGYGFKYASELKIGDKLRSVSGDIYEVIDTEVEHFGIPIKVYNFEVEDWHTYAVSEVGIFVHNSKGCGESTSNEQTTEQPSEPQPNTGTAQATTTQQGTAGKGGSTSIKKSNHAIIRSGQGRNVNTAINDINKSSPSRIFLQDDGRIVIKGDRGRVHILESDGEIVTTMNKVTNFNDRVLSGRYRPLTETERIEFVNKFDEYLGKAWDEYRELN